MMVRVWKSGARAMAGVKVVWVVSAGEFSPRFSQTPEKKLSGTYFAFTVIFFGSAATVLGRVGVRTSGKSCRIGTGFAKLAPRSL